MAQLGKWEADPDIAAQYSAVSAILTRNGCHLVQSIFYSGFGDVPEKIMSGIRQEVERTAKNSAAGLNTAGVWSLSLRIPTSGINVNEVRRNIIASLQKDASESLKPAKSAILLSDEQGQNMLKNDNSLDVVFLVWR
jgi:hypothetical protein